MIALQKGYAFKGVIDLYGVTNFMTFNDWYSKYDWQEEKNVIDFLGSLDKELLIEASPMTYVKEKMNLPPNGMNLRKILFLKFVPLLLCLSY